MIDFKVLERLEREMNRALDLHPIWPASRLEQGVIIGKHFSQLMRAVKDELRHGSSVCIANEECLHIMVTVLRFLRGRSSA